MHHRFFILIDKIDALIANFEKDNYLKSQKLN